MYDIIGIAVQRYNRKSHSYANKPSFRAQWDLRFGRNHATPCFIFIPAGMRHEAAHPSGPRIFLSYCLTDVHKEWAGSVKVDLENYGVESIINFRETSVQTLQQQLQSCEVLVMLVTPGYIKALQQSSSSNYREVGLLQDSGRRTAVFVHCVDLTRDVQGLRC